MYRYGKTAGRTELPRKRVRTASMRLVALVSLIVFTCSLRAQQSFDVASVRLSSGQVRFENDGEVEYAHGALRMHDVRLITCIKWAYGLQRAQVIEPEGMEQQHYDIVAKTSPETTVEQAKVMLQALLADRFALAFHRGTKETTAYVVTVSPSGLKKLKPAAQEGEAWHQNSAMGMVARNWTMLDFVTYLSDPLGAPMVDETHLPGKYDFSIDFRPYVDQAAEIHADPQSVLKATAEGELGLRFVRRKAAIETFVIDHVQAPTEN